MISSALEAIHDRRLQELSEYTHPLANIAAILVAVNSSKKSKIEENKFNPYPRAIKIREIQKTLDPDTAKVIIDLINERLLPSWVQELLPTKNDIKTAFKI